MVGAYANRFRCGRENDDLERAAPHLEAGPIAAALAGYAFIYRGEVSQLGTWPEAFAKTYPKLGDAAIIAGAHKFLQGAPTAAENWFKKACERCVPLFTMGAEILRKLYPSCDRLLPVIDAGTLCTSASIHGFQSFIADLSRRQWETDPLRLADLTWMQADA
jgi:hypothetical protein